MHSSEQKIKFSNPTWGALRVHSRPVTGTPALGRVKLADVRCWGACLAFLLGKPCWVSSLKRAAVISGSRCSSSLKTHCGYPPRSLRTFPSLLQSSKIVAGPQAKSLRVLSLRLRVLFPEKCRNNSEDSHAAKNSVLTACVSFRITNI